MTSTSAIERSLIHSKYFAPTANYLRNYLRRLIVASSAGVLDINWQATRGTIASHTRTRLRSHARWRSVKCFFREETMRRLFVKLSTSSGYRCRVQQSLLTSSMIITIGV